jgi:hypothetical protein
LLRQVLRQYNPKVLAEVMFKKDNMTLWLVGISKVAIIL